jgi:hypothetical protein
MQRNIIVSVAAVIIVILLLPVVLNKVGGWRNQAGRGNTLQQEYDRIRAEGQPLSFEELDAWYERPAQNGADLYLKAFDAHVEPSPELEANLPLESGGALPPRGQALPEATRQAIQEYVRLNGNSIALLHEAATRPHCRYPIDLRKGVAVELPDLARIRRSSRLLAENAVLLADTGDVAGAADALAGVFALANSLQNEPLLISQLVRAACAQIGIEALKWAVQRASSNDAQLAKLSDALAPFSNDRTFWRALAGEQCMYIGTWDTRMGPGFDATIGALSPEFRSKVDVDGLRKHVQGALFEDDLVYMLHILDLAIQGAKLPPEEGHSKLQEAMKLVQEAPSDYLITNYNGGSGQSNVFAGIRATEARDRMVAGSRTAAAALAVKRYQLQNGALPDLLGQVVPRYMPAVPLDPYDGQPLRYRKEPVKYVVYSISKNGRDDGGVEGADMKQEWTSGDITFAVSL